MRACILIFVLLLSPAAMSQTPEPDNKGDGKELVLKMPDDRQLFLKAPDDGRVLVPVPPGGSIDEGVLKELQGAGLTPVPWYACDVDYTDIDAEEKVSDERFRALRGKVIPLQHQYEQELYYQDRRAKRFEKTCGKQSERQAKYSNTPKRDDMTVKACEVIGVVCKPVKHW